MLGRQSDQRGLWEADSLYIDHVVAGVSTACWPQSGGSCFGAKTSVSRIAPTTGGTAFLRAFWQPRFCCRKAVKNDGHGPDGICICEGGVLARPGCVEARGTLQVREDASYFWAPPPHRPLPAGPVSGTWSCCPIWTPSVLYPKYTGKSGRRWPGFGRRSWSRQKVWGPRW